MKVTFETEDMLEAKRLAKAEDMAGFIFQLVNNSWRQFKHDGIDYEPIYKKIYELLAEYNINIDELIE